jgi:hypothetical protein
MEEEWRPTDCPKYQVSNLGRVRSSKTHRGWGGKEGDPDWKYLACTPGPIGYPTCAINSQTTNIHRLVAKAFLPPPTEEQTQIDHIDRNRANNVATNLRWVTAKENVRNRAIYDDPMYAISECQYKKGCWRVCITADKKQTHVGVFKTIEEAQAARDAYLLDGTMPPPRRDPDLVGICQIKKTGRWKVAFRKHGLIEYHGEFATVEEAKAKRNEVRPIHPAA